MEKTELKNIVEAIYLLEDIHECRLSATDRYDVDELSAQFPQYDREVLKTIISKYNLIWMEFNHKCFMWDLDDNQVGIECPYSLATTDIVNQLYRALNK